LQKDCLRGDEAKGQSQNGSLILEAVQAGWNQRKVDRSSIAKNDINHVSQWSLMQHQQLKTLLKPCQLVQTNLINSCSVVDRCVHAF
jgi:hypothetical protein